MLRDGEVDAEVKVGIKQEYSYKMEKHRPVTVLHAVSRIPCDSEGNI